MAIVRFLGELLRMVIWLFFLLIGGVLVMVMGAALWKSSFAQAPLVGLVIGLVCLGITWVLGSKIRSWG